MTSQINIKIQFVHFVLHSVLQESAAASLGKGRVTHRTSGKFIAVPQRDKDR